MKYPVKKENSEISFGSKYSKPSLPRHITDELLTRTIHAPLRHQYIKTFKKKLRKPLHRRKQLLLISIGPFLAIN